MLPRDPYDVNMLKGSNIGESCSYLGLVSMALFSYTALCRVRFPRASYWWVALGLLVVLSGGVAWTLGPVTVRLPGNWLWNHVFLVRLIRAPARFNLLAAVVAAVPAAAGMRHLVGRFPTRAARGVACCVVGIVALADLSVTPFNNGGEMLPRLPACYEFIKGHDPKAAIVDVPQSSSGWAIPVNGVCTYWQSLHRRPTTAGYGGVTNIAYDALVTAPSPFALECLADRDYLATPQSERLAPTDFRGDVWAYLTSHRIRYVVIHSDARILRNMNEARILRNVKVDKLLDTRVLERVRSQLESAKVFEDEDATVYDRELLGVRKPGRD